MCVGPCAYGWGWGVCLWVGQGGVCVPVFFALNDDITSSYIGVGPRCSVAEDRDNRYEL